MSAKRDTSGPSLEWQIDRAAEDEAPVLITGGTAASRWAAARNVHQRSGRSATRLGMVTCEALPQALLESELFGHRRGSFAGAFRDKPGVLVLVSAGSVFLSEVTALTPRLQKQLLTFLEMGTLQPLGGEVLQVGVNVRLLTATSVDLTRRATAGGFLPDLYRRLSQLRIQIAPVNDPEGLRENLKGRGRSPSTHDRGRPRGNSPWR
jgi:DNA-binding NtrC family response regulator